MALGDLIHAKPYETIVARVRRHYITFVPTIVFFILLTLVPFGLWFLIRNIFPHLLTGAISLPILIMVASIYYLSLMLFFYTAFIEFYLDIHIITNDRLVDVEQITLFARRISEVDLYQIQDASSVIKGFFATLFKYGNLEIQTAGTVPKFIMENVPHPHELRQRLLDLAAEDKRHHRNGK